MPGGVGGNQGQAEEDPLEVEPQRTQRAQRPKDMRTQIPFDLTIEMRREEGRREDVLRFLSGLSAAVVAMVMGYLAARVDNVVYTLAAGAAAIAMVVASNRNAR